MGFFELVYRTTPQRASRGESTIRSRWIKSGLAGFIHSQYFFFIAVEPVNDGLPKFGNLIFEGKPPPLISSKKKTVRVDVSPGTVDVSEIRHLKKRNINSRLVGETTNYHSWLVRFVSH